MLAQRMQATEKASTLFQDKQQARCVKHNALRPSVGWSEDAGCVFEDASLKLVLGGSACKAWSSKGSQCKDGDPNVRPFLIFTFNLGDTGLLRHKNRSKRFLLLFRRRAIF